MDINVKDLLQKVADFKLKVEVNCGDPNCKGVHDFEINAEGVGRRANNMIRAFGFEADIIGAGEEMVGEGYVAAMFLGMIIAKERFKDYDKIVEWVKNAAKLLDETDKELKVREAEVELLEGLQAPARA